MNILVGIPCYNCETQIVRVLKELDAILDDCPSIKGIAVIDNRSTDGTVAAAKKSISELKHKDKFSVFRNTVNAGLGGTHKIVFTMAQKNGFSHLMILHGDHQASALDVPSLIQKSEINSGVTVLGSRFRDITLLSGFSKVRIAGNIALNIFYTFGSGRRVSDLGSGLNLFKLTDLKMAEVQDFDNGFTFNMDLLLNLIKNNRTFEYVPIHWSTTDQISNVNAFKVGWKTAKKLIFWIFHVYPKDTHHSETEKLTYDIV